MAASDQRKFSDRTLSDPVEHVEAITPHDVNELARVTRALYIGTTGHVAVVMVDGSQAVHKNVQAGSTLPLSVKQVLANGTTALDIVGWA